MSLELKLYKWEFYFHLFRFDWNMNIINNILRIGFKEDVVTEHGRFCWKNLDIINVGFIRNKLLILKIFNKRITIKLKKENGDV